MFFRKCSTIIDAASSGVNIVSSRPSADPQTRNAARNTYSGPGKIKSKGSNSDAPSEVSPTIYSYPLGQGLCKKATRLIEIYWYSGKIDGVKSKLVNICGK